MIRNLTGHTVHFSTGETIKSEGNVVIQFDRRSMLLDGIQVIAQEVLGTHNLPDYENDVYYIVPGLVRLAFPDRRDLLSVGGTSRIDGQIKVRFLLQNPRR